MMICGLNYYLVKIRSKYSPALGNSVYLINLPKWAIFKKYGPKVSDAQFKIQENYLFTRYH